MPSGWEKAPGYGERTGGLGNVASLAAVVMVALVLTNCSVEGAEQREAKHAAADASQIVGVASVVDGDTIEIHSQRIRLSGYDTPESGAHCGDTNVYQAAALALSDFIANRTVSCVPTGTDRYDRVTATCSVGGTDLGEYVVSQGWGRDWPRYSNGAYAGEEEEARSARRGLWGLHCPASLWGDRDYSR